MCDEYWIMFVCFLVIAIIWAMTFKDLMQTRNKVIDIVDENIDELLESKYERFIGDKEDEKSNAELLQDARNKYLVCTCHYGGYEVIPRMPAAIAFEFSLEHLKMKSQPCPMHK